MCPPGLRRSCPYHSQLNKAWHPQLLSDAASALLVCCRHPSWVSSKTIPAGLPPALTTKIDVMSHLIRRSTPIPSLPPFRARFGRHPGAWDTPPFTPVTPSLLRTEAIQEACVSLSRGMTVARLRSVPHRRNFWAFNCSDCPRLFPPFPPSPCMHRFGRSPTSLWFPRSDDVPHDDF